MAAITGKSPKPKFRKHLGTGAARHHGGSPPARREEQARRATTLLKLINDPVRLEIIMVLAEGEQHVGALRAQLILSQTSVGHHLALLRHGGIVTPRRQGTHHFYSLTDTGSGLAEVVHGLTGGHATQTTTARPAASRESSPRRGSPRAVGRQLVDLPIVPELRYDREDGSEEESLGRLNRRRAELIFKNNRNRLSEAEQSELEQLQKDSLSRLQRDFPVSSEIDDQLRKIEERLRGKRAEKA
jgi:DNA-binding transcriptional ArsR family regulator